MGLLCKFGFHSWTACKCTVCGKVRDEDHSWDGCKCTVCGKVRNEDHSWDGCKCTVCGKVKNTGHHGCRCTVCGKIRDEDHSWDGCKCTVCGKVRDEDHSWDGCRCTVCGTTREQGHSCIGCKCNTCGKLIHHWHYCKCTRCGTFRHTHHDWDGPKCLVCGRISPHYQLINRFNELRSILKKEDTNDNRGPGLYPMRPTLETYGRIIDELESIVPIYEEVICALISHLDGPWGDRCTRSLIKFGAPAVPAILQAIPKCRTMHRQALWHALFALGQMGITARQAIPLMLQIAEEEDNWDTRRIAMLNILSIDKSYKEKVVALVDKLYATDKLSWEQAKNLEHEIAAAMKSDNIIKYLGS